MRVMPLYELNTVRLDDIIIMNYCRLERMSYENCDRYRCFRRIGM